MTRTKAALLVAVGISVLLIEGCAVAPKARCGFYTWKPGAQRPLNDISEAEGGFEATIERQYSTEHENMLLAIVEATYPVCHNSVLRQGLRRPKNAEQPTWWLSTLEGMRIPVTLTRASVEYLVDLIRAFRKGEFGGSSGLPQKAATLEYYAEIESAQTALERGTGVLTKDLFVVRMELEWSSDCGPRCGLRFTRTRTALVHESGTLVEVLEDPWPPVLVD